MTAYLLSAILGLHGWVKYRSAYINEEVPKTYPSLDTAIEHFLNEGKAKIDLVQFANEYGEAYINNVAQFARNWLPDFLSTEQSFEDIKVDIRLAETTSGFQERVLTSPLERTVFVGNIQLNALKEARKPILDFYTSAEGSISEVLPARPIKDFVVTTVFRLFSVYVPTPPPQNSPATLR